MGYFQCDDGNLATGDGCDGNCRVEKGFKCVGGTAVTKDTCTTICGDSIRVGTEACDDGNNVNGDGCSSICLVEAGYTCTGGSV